MATKKSSGGSSTRSQAASHTTTDHEKIRKWAEERRGKPSCVKGTGGKKDVGLLRIDFPGYSGEGSLQQISWKEFFEKFDEQKLALLYQDQTKSGENSNFNKLISRSTAAKSGKSGASSAKHGRSSRR
jgi:hypothetical protein